MDAMKTYRPKAGDVKAVQFLEPRDGKPCSVKFVNYQDCVEKGEQPPPGTVVCEILQNKQPFFSLYTHEGYFSLHHQDWIVEEDGKYYRLHDYVFTARYEEKPE